MFAFKSPRRKSFLTPVLRMAESARLLWQRSLRPIAPLRRAAMAVIALGAVAACEPIDTTAGRTGPAINTSAPVPVALLVPRGSANASDEVLARSLENAARLAIADLGDVAIDLRVYGTAGAAASAQQAALQAVADGAAIILGPGGDAGLAQDVQPPLGAELERQYGQQAAEQQAPEQQIGHAGIGWGHGNHT